MKQPGEAAYAVTSWLSIGGIEGAADFERPAMGRDAGRDFRASMGSAAHRRSRARIPRDPHASHVVAVCGYHRVA